MSVRGFLKFLWKNATGGGAMLKPGDPAPEFDTTDQHGRPLRLRDLRGEKVVLWFFPKADTPG
jgi:peroxiredoxin